MYSLKNPSHEDSYDRKYFFPTKAIELMTNENIFESFNWDKSLIQKYIK